ncbi:MAG: CBS domain-containing protein, partial [Anaerolineae bacterium]|nr:CBS domain-containing protein [Anaerolineae bacterium]
ALKNHTRLGRETEVYLQQRHAEEVMTTPVFTVTPTTSLREALQLLVEKQIKRLPVVDADGKLVGLVGRGGILQALGRIAGLGLPL